MMENTLKLLIILLFTISFSSCKNKVQKRIDLIEKTTDSLYKSIDNIKDLPKLKMSETKFKIIKDSLNKILSDKKYKQKYGEEVCIKIDSTENKLNYKREKIYIKYASKIIKGHYKGQGPTFSYLPNWGNIKSGLLFTETIINDNGDVEIASMNSQILHWDKSKCSLAEIEIISDTSINGKFIFEKNEICNFEWKPNNLLLFSISKWQTYNDKIK